MLRKERNDLERTIKLKSDAKQDSAKERQRLAVVSESLEKSLEREKEFKARKELFERAYDKPKGP
jgi:hypothetical protein